MPDELPNLAKQDKKVRIIPTGPIKPLKKRLFGSKKSESEIYAFIDSDAYPAPDWLSNAVQHFRDPEVAATCGPSLTPDSDDDRARAGGLVLSSFFCSGQESSRYKQLSVKKYVKETPTCNIRVRKSILNKIQGIAPDVWPGEEIVFCAFITKNLKKKILYDPKVVVFHHRRRLYLEHFRQVWHYGFVKGMLTRVYPSYIRPFFFLPSILLLSVILGLVLGIVNQTIGIIYISMIVVYGGVILAEGIHFSVREKKIGLVLLISSGIIGTHLCYGLAFLVGLFSRKVDLQASS